MVPSKILMPKRATQGSGHAKEGPRDTKAILRNCRKALAEMVIIDEMPFRSVEGEGFRRYSKVLQPRFDPSSRITVARDCMQ